MVEYSVEVFPPRDNAGGGRFETMIASVVPYGPKYVSVTYGAGGSGQLRTRHWAPRLARTAGVPIAAHLTLVGADRPTIDKVVSEWWLAGIRRIVALRGDVPDGGKFQPRPGGYHDVPMLIAGLKRIAPFEIAVAAYPEKHPDAPDSAADMEHLKRKFDAGADFAITQFFFRPETFLDFVEKARAAGIDKPIIPGILPIRNVEAAKRLAQQCGATLPDEILAPFLAAGDDAEARRQATAEQLRSLVEPLRAAGVDRFHLYALNSVEPVRILVDLLGLATPESARPEEAA